MRLPEPDVGIVHARVHAPPPKPGLWHGPYRWKPWVIDWCGYAGRSTEIIVGSQSLGVWPRPPRSWHLFAPNVAYRHHDAVPVPSSEQLWFFFDLPRPWRLVAGRPVTVIVDDEERLGPHIHAMRELQHHGEPGHLIALHARALLVLGEIAVAAGRGGDGSFAHPWRVGAARKSGTSLLHLIERETLRDLRRPPSVDDLAERLSMSASSLCHRFKQETGGTVMARVRWLRVREARRLLAEPGATLKDVARALGFSSPFHLSAQFHRLTGTTASEYMRRQRG